VGSIASGKREEAINLVCLVGGKLTNRLSSASYCLGSFEEAEHPKEFERIPMVREKWLYGYFPLHLRRL